MQCLCDSDKGTVNQFANVLECNSKVQAESSARRLQKIPSARAPVPRGFVARRDI